MYTIIYFYINDIYDLVTHMICYIYYFSIFTAIPS